MIFEPPYVIDSKMKKILTLTINPALDVSTRAPRVMPVRKLRCDPAERDPGGGGINVARVLERLGADVTALFTVGGSSGDMVRRLVAAEGVKNIAVPIAGETRENFTVNEGTSHQQFRFVLKGPVLSEGEQQACIDALTENLSDGDILVASGSLPEGAPPGFYASAATVAAASGAGFVLDTSGEALTRALGAGVSLIKPNLRELGDMVGGDLATERAQIDACKKLVAAGKTAAVALTLGAEGALLVTAAGVWRARPPKVATESAVGAGDSFTAGMVWGMAAGWEIEKAFSLGIAAGAAAALTPGTELCHADDVWRFADQIQPEQLS